jgi:hypothetical protein
LFESIVEFDMLVLCAVEITDVLERSGVHIELVRSEGRIDVTGLEQSPWRHRAIHDRRMRRVSDQIEAREGSGAVVDAVFELTVDGLEERMLEEQTKEENSAPFDVSRYLSSRLGSV